MTSESAGRSTNSARVFLSWSGESSRLVAKALSAGMQQLSERLEPWLSEDLEPGAEWASTLVPQIRKAKLAVLCLTRRNVGAVWIAFETGAYYGSRLRKGVVPYLLDIQPAELTFPLGLFQSVTADWLGTKSLFARVGELVELDASVVEERLASTIWPQLNDQLTVIRKLQAEAQETARSSANVANAFFLGHDLRWTIDVSTSDAPPKDVKHGIRQILHQATDLGIEHENGVQALQRVAQSLLDLPDEEWTTEIRGEVDLALRLAFERIGAVMTRLQPEYRAYDPENQQSWIEMQAEGRA
jgi:hypothetical protein